MLVHFEGRDWELDLSDINLKPAMVIQGYTGLSVQGFVDSLADEIDGDGNVVAAAADKPGFLRSFGALYWLMKQQNDVHCPIGDVDFPLGKFSAAISDAMDREAAELADVPEPEPDPTRPPADCPPSPEPSSPSQPPDTGESPGG